MRQDRRRIMGMRVAAILLLLAGLAACGVQRGVPTPGGSSPAPVAAASCDAFAPRTMRIHPLTHIDAITDKGGTHPVLVLHVELKDRYGDTVKWLGAMQVTMSRPVVGMTPGLETQELRWDVREFHVADTNAAYFDPTTRTYRIVLETPEWVGRLLSEAPKGDGPPAYVKVKAVLSIQAEGRERFVSDEFVVRK